MGTENRESCSQRDSAERKGYVRAHRSFNRIWKERDSAEPDILGKILNKDNLNRAYKRVKANKGAPGIDGMTIEATLPWLKEHNRELTERIRRGKYTPSPVKRVEIPGSVKNFVALVKNSSFLVRITDMTILIEKEFIYGSSKRPNPTDYYRK